MRSMISLAAVLVAASLAAAQEGVTSRVNLDSSGAQALASASAQPAISADGRFVAFWSQANNLVPGDTNGCADTFVHDMQNGATTRVSVDSSGLQSDSFSTGPSAVSADGRFVAFASKATNLVPNDTNFNVDVFVHDMQSGMTERVSVSSSGVEGDLWSDCSRFAISSNGRYVAFSSVSTNLVAGDTNGTADVFVRDRTLGKTNRVSVDSGGLQGNRDSWSSAISGNGRFVAFLSQSTFVPNDTNSTADIYLFDRLGALTTLASVDSNGVQGNGYSFDPALSATGRFLAFESVSSNLIVGDSNAAVDEFVRDLGLGTTTRVNVSSTGEQAQGDSRNLSISADGRFVAFESYASNLVSGDTNGVNGLDTFVHDRITGSTVRTGVDSSGAQADATCYQGTISGDGRRIAFQSSASNLVPNDTNGACDIFVREILCAPPSNYCEAGLSTNFCSPAMSATGIASASAASGFTLTCSGLEAEKSALIFYGVNGRLAQPWGPVGGSLLCVAQPVQRMPISDSGGTPSFCDGSISIDWLGFLVAHPNALGQPLTPGAVLDAQCWYRDPPAPKGTNLSNAIEWTLCP
jgi:hypothetical protein